MRAREIADRRAELEHRAGRLLSHIGEVLGAHAGAGLVDRPLAEQIDRRALEPRAGLRVILASRVAALDLQAVVAAEGADERQGAFDLFEQLLAHFWVEAAQRALEEDLGRDDVRGRAAADL